MSRPHITTKRVTGVFHDACHSLSRHLHRLSQHDQPPDNHLEELGR